MLTVAWFTADRHREFTGWTPGTVRLGAMKIPFTILGGLVAYFIASSTNADLAPRMVQALPF